MDYEYIKILEKEPRLPLKKGSSLSQRILDEFLASGAKYAEVKVPPEQKKIGTLKGLRIGLGLAIARRNLHKEIEVREDVRQNIVYLLKKT